MAQTATMTKLRGRHYAAKARAAGSATSANNETSVSKAAASNENLARRLKTSTTRFQNTRSYSPSRYESPGKNRRNDNENYNATNTSTQENNTNTNHLILDREMELVKGISDRLDTGLNEQALGAILDLLKRGEQPDAIVAVVTSLAQHAR